jgi:hypothetical protein
MGATTPLKVPTCNTLPTRVAGVLSRVIMRSFMTHQCAVVITAAHSAGYACLTPGEGHLHHVWSGKPLPDVCRMTHAGSDGCACAVFLAPKSGTGLGSVDPALASTARRITVHADCRLRVTHTVGGR